MEVNKVGTRGYVFNFDELLDSEFNCTTNVYVIDGKNYIFICDTFLGPKSMELITEFIDKHFKTKQIIVFNSHSDWDHIWGNCFFRNNLIVSHETCREDMKKNAEIELCKYKKYSKGKVEIYLPNLTFSNKLCFDEEEIEFFYSPGHTSNSASCIDKKDNILFVGDNVESPHPYVNNDDFYAYRDTLNAYIDINAEIIIPGHGEIADYKLVTENLNYIKSMA